MIATILTLCSTISAQRVAPSDQLTMYFEADDLPNAVVWLPAPPDTTSTQFLYDITQYMWGKEQRYINKERAKQAIDNATTDVAEMAQQFSGAFGMEITPEKTPAIFKVLYRGVLTCRLSATMSKNAYMRKRPYVRFSELSVGHEPSHCWLSLAERCGCLLPAHLWLLCPSTHQSRVPGRHGRCPCRIRQETSDEHELNTDSCERRASD